MRTPKVLYAAHGRLTQRLFGGRPFRAHHRVALAAVRWTLDRFEMWEGRHGLRALRDQALRAEIVAERVEALRVITEALIRSTERKDGANE